MYETTSALLLYPLIFLDSFASNSVIYVYTSVSVSSSLAKDAAPTTAYATGIASRVTTKNKEMMAMIPKERDILETPVITLEKVRPVFATTFDTADGVWRNTCKKDR